MIAFRYKWCQKDGTPIVRDEVIQDYAESLLKEYKPQLLKEPQQINPMHFLESYLGANLELMDIYAPEGARIAGATIIRGGEMLVFDREGLCIRPVFVPAGTIVIDNETLLPGSEEFAVFTMLHEGGHFCMHRNVHPYDTARTYESENAYNSRSAHFAARCSGTSIQERKRTLITEEDFREHQANTFAAAIAMPRPVFIPLAQRLIREQGQSGGIWFEPELPRPGYHEMGLDLILDTLACTFGVSRTAVRVQMQRQGLLKIIENRRDNRLIRDPWYYGTSAF